MKDKTALFVNAEIAVLAKRFYNDYFWHHTRAYAIFEWMTRNVRYDEEKLHRIEAGGNPPMRGPRETLEEKKGVCIEQAYLYTSIARAANLEAGIVDVLKTRDGKREHACSSVKLWGDIYYVDPAYETFAIKHRKVRRMSDLEVEEYFHTMNKRELPPFLTKTLSDEPTPTGIILKTWKRKLVTAAFVATSLYGTGIYTGIKVKQIEQQCRWREAQSAKDLERSLEMYLECAEREIKKDF